MIASDAEMMSVVFASNVSCLYVWMFMHLCTCSRKCVGVLLNIRDISCFLYASCRLHVCVHMVVGQGGKTQLETSGSED